MSLMDILKDFQVDFLKFINYADKIIDLYSFAKINVVVLAQIIIFQ